jgi:PAS domain-containing protein
MTELQVLYAVCAVLGGLFITGIGAAYVVFKFQQEEILSPIKELRDSQVFFKNEVSDLKTTIHEIEKELHRRLTLKDGTPIETVIEKMSEQFELMADRDLLNFYLDSQPKYECDTNGFCTRVNEKYSELTGIQERNAIGNGWTEAIHPNDRDRVFRMWTDFIEMGFPFDCRYRINSNTNNDGIRVHGRAFSKREGDHIKLIIGTMEVV